MIWWIIIAILFITCYVLPAIICYGLTLPYCESLYYKYIVKGVKLEGGYVLEKVILLLSLLGPIGLWAFLYADKTKYCGFRFRRKYTKGVADGQQIIEVYLQNVGKNGGKNS